ncbi:MAG: TetR/AcrR family transcriptional regulator [Pseudomonadota bacterium]|jgi:AcrR family transcriptional regulator
MTRTLHQIKSEQTRERLLGAALDLMHTKGHGQLSVHEVARAAGMTAGAVQHHFTSKAALMLEVITRLIAQLEEASDFWPPADWPLQRRADHFVQQAWATLYGHPRFAVAWSAYLAAREDEGMVAHIVARRGLLTASLQQRMGQSFPEMCRGPQAEARVQFVLSALRGMGLVAPFSPAAAVPEQLQVLSQYLQSFQTQET